MLHNNLLIGSLTDAYSAADVAAGKTPKLGTEFYDNKTAKKYVFLKNSESSSAIATGKLTVSVAADRALKQVKLASTVGSACFAGIREVGATDLAAGESGWFQVTGDFTNVIVAATGSVASTDMSIVTGADGGAHGVAPTGYNSPTGFSGALAPFALSSSVQASAGSAFSGTLLRSVYA